MKEINKLESYLQQRTAERKKRNRRLIVVGVTTLLLIGLVWSYFLITHKKQEENGLAHETETSLPKPTENINKSPEDDSSLVQPNPAQAAQFVSLAIKGKFEVGERIDFILENADGENRHYIDFGDSKEMSIKNRTQHIYHKAGDYKVTFKPAASDETVEKMISIQQKPVDKKTKEVFTQTIQDLEPEFEVNAFKADKKVDKLASFPGGSAALMAYFQTHIGTVSGYKGRVLVGFDIGEDGIVSNISIIDGINTKVNQQILSAFKAMPAWTPAQKAGKNVPSRYQLPFYFDEHTE